MNKLLKNGMIIELRNNDRFIIIDGIGYNNNGYTLLKIYDEDLKLMHSIDREFDIMKIYKSKDESILRCFNNNNLELIWERKEVNWDKVEIGTKVLVSKDYDPNTEDWCKRQFYMKNNNGVFLTANKLLGTETWVQCKLIEKQHELKINKPKGKIIRTTIRINEDILELFKVFCKEHKEFTQKNLIGQALLEFVEKYK